VTTLVITFPVTLEREDRNGAYYEVTHELRAEVTFRGVLDEPSVTPLERAHWLDTVGPEGGEEWIGAEEQAIEAAWQQMRSGEKGAA
jgi:hypothetical protein